MPPPEPPTPKTPTPAPQAPASLSDSGTDGSSNGTPTPAPETRSQRLQRRQRRSLIRQAFGTKLLTTFALFLTFVTLVVFTTAGLVINDTANRGLEKQLGERLESVAGLAAMQLNKPFTLSQATDPDPSVRREATRRLASVTLKIKETSSVREVLLFRYGGRDDYQLLASSKGEGAFENALSRLHTDALYIERAVNERSPVSSSLYPIQDEDGNWQISKIAYAPIINGNQILGTVGVEVPSTYTGAVEEVNNSFTFLGACAGLTVLATAVFLVRQRVHLPLYRLVKAMQGEDGTPQRARVRHQDEIGVLTERYNDMVDHLTEKDQELRELYAHAQETAAYLKGYSNHLVAGVPSGVVAVDPEGVLNVWNESATRILREDSRVGEFALEAFGEGHPLAHALQTALKGSVTDQALVVLEDTPGDEEAQRLVELTCAPFRDDQGELLGAVALVTDRTELERFRQVAARNERLAAIGNLGAGLAHEIKNPLGAISGFAELIERRTDEAPVLRLAGRLRGEVDELNSFLNLFLNFTREDTIRREAIDLNLLAVRSVELALQSQTDLDPDDVASWRERGQVPLECGEPLHVDLELDESLPRMALDEALLRSAVTNLARNAIEVMRASGGRLTVKTQRLGDQAFVRVRDTGPGVPLELREKIFNPLFTTRAEGTGLGLAIANKTVNAHGGKLSLRDPAGGGAEFVIRLPVVAAAGSEG